MKWLLVEAQTTTNVKEQMSNCEREFILENASRTLWNMVPDKNFKFTNDKGGFKDFSADFKKL